MATSLPPSSTDVSSKRSGKKRAYRTKERTHPSNCRIARFDEIKEFRKRILVTTDLFARGVDVSKINVVINFDMPLEADSYLHRVGRAGRFGTKGLAISFVCSEDEAAVLNQVQERFVVNIPVMPAQIDCSSYMSTAK